MAFDALETTIQLATALRQPLARLRQQDRDLAQHARQACNSIGLNLDEARGRAGGDRTQQFRIALGSAHEVRTALRLAVAWGYLGPADVSAPLALLDRIIAMTWRLLNRR
jgi:four helix bundle protein